MNLFMPVTLLLYKPVYLCGCTYSPFIQLTAQIILNTTSSIIEVLYYYSVTILLSGALLSLVSLVIFLSKCKDNKCFLLFTYSLSLYTFVEKAFNNGISATIILTICVLYLLIYYMILINLENKKGKAFSLHIFIESICSLNKLRIYCSIPVAPTCLLVRHEITYNVDIARLYYKVIIFTYFSLNLPTIATGRILFGVLYWYVLETQLPLGYIFIGDIFKGKTTISKSLVFYCIFLSFFSFIAVSCS